MKIINMEIRIDELSGRLAVARSCKGFDPKNISHQLELLGVLDTLVAQQQELIKTLGRAGKVI
jgi:hypothetical protein